MTHTFRPRAFILVEFRETFAVRFSPTAFLTFRPSVALIIHGDRKQRLAWDRIGFGYRWSVDSLRVSFPQKSLIPPKSPSCTSWLASFDGVISWGSTPFPKRTWITENSGSSVSCSNWGRHESATYSWLLGNSFFLPILHAESSRLAPQYH